MDDRIHRRDALRRLAQLCTSAVASAALLACKSKPSCNDVTGLSTDELTARNVAAGYLPRSPDAAKTCNNCVHFVAAAPNACGGCKVVKGPVDAEAYCRLWTARPA